MFDVDALLAKLIDMTAERTRTVVREEIAAALAAKPAPRVYSLPQLAERFGRSPDAMRMWIQPTRSGAELGALAREIGGRKFWREEDIEGFIARRPKLRAIASGAK